MKWHEVPLSKVALINPGRPRNLGIRDDQPVSFVPMPAVSEQSAAIEHPNVRPYAEVKKGFTYFEESDILFAKITPCMENGKSAIATGLIGGIGFGSTEFHVIRPDQSLLLPKYVHYFVRQQSFRDNAKARMRGAVGQQRVSKDFLDDTMIPLPSISEQRRIVEILDQADRLRKLRNDAEAKAKLILPSLFYKMFGDPATNPKGWPVKRLGDPQIATINPKFAYKSVSDAMVFSFVPMADVEENWGRIIGKQVRPYSEAKRGFTPFQNDDVLFAKITPCMQNGKAAIARNLINGHGFGSTEFHVLRAGPSVTPEWLYSLVRLPWFKKQAEASFTGTAGQQRVPANFLQRYKVACPPGGLQLKFANAVVQLLKRSDQADGSKQAIDRLFATLLHRAFTGDLSSSWREAHMEELLVEMEEQYTIKFEQSSLP